MRPLVLLLGLSAIACAPSPVRWDEPSSTQAGSIAADARLAMTADGVARLQELWRPPTWPHEVGLCEATLRAVQAPGGEAYASWFSVRPDSSVILRVARSTTGGEEWLPAVTADSTDVGRAGCARPVPYLAADSLNGYVHLAYNLDAREGAGLFFTHSMEQGQLFHSPVPIVYGDRPSAAAVASRGDTVVVAYEDPNSRSPRLSLALSRTQGHIFEHRLTVSDETAEARTPRVEVRGGRLAVAWTESQRGGAQARIVIRLGTLEWE